MPPPRLKRSNTANASPASLEDGEIAINQADGKLWYRTVVGGVDTAKATPIDGSVTTASIADGSITTAKIADGAVVTVDIANSAVTYAKIQNVSANMVLGRSATSGVVEEITCTAFGRSVLDDVDAAAARTTLGLGSIATQASSSVSIAGGSINGTTIGATTASTGAFTTLGATGVITASAGSVSAPSIAFTGDSNTGIYSPGADQLAVATGGTQRIYVGATGQVGIGTAAPNNLLVVSAADTSNSLTNSSAAITLVVANSSAFGRTTNLNFNQGDSNAAQRIATIAGVYTAYSTAVGGALAFSTADGTGAVPERMRLSHTGNLGIGTTSPVSRLHVSSSDNAVIAMVGGGTCGVRIGAASVGGVIDAVDSTGVTTYQPLLVGGSDVRLRVSGMEAARLNSTGFGIGTQAPASALDVNGVITRPLGSATAPSIAFAGDSNTGTFSPGADQWAVTTGGSQKMVISAAGECGVGSSAQANIRLNVYSQGPNLASSVGSQVFHDPTSTVSGSYASFGGVFIVRPDIAAGVTDTGPKRAAWFQALRNIKGSSGTDAGTASAVRGAEMHYGHSNQNTELTPTTAQVVGLLLQPYNGYGTVADMYDLYISSDTFSLGTITNHYGVFQAASTTKNYFAGHIGIGSGKTAPASALDVNGVITISAGSAAAPAICFSGDTNTGLWSPAADTLAISTGGSERLRITSSGAVGVGTTPSSDVKQLSTRGTASAATAEFGQFAQLEASTTAGTAAKYGTHSLIVATAAQTAGNLFVGVSSAFSSLSSSALHQYRGYNANCTMSSGGGSLASYVGFIAQGANVTGGTVTAQYGFQVGADFNTAATNIGFYSTLAAASGCWGLYMGGTAQNYFAGNVGIGSGKTAPATALDVAGVITATASAGTAALDINGDTLRVRTARTPASATAPGNVGDFCWDSTYLYVCTAANTWRRISHSTW
jgi:hypothetical protein